MDKYYNILQINNNCSKDELRKQYLHLSKLYHPDKNNGDDSKMKELVEAYNYLQNSIKEEAITDINIVSIITLQDVCLGKSIHETFTRIVKCDTCNEFICEVCDGKKYILKNIAISFLNLQQQVVCEGCNGIGFQKCKCNKKEIINIIFNIPKGVFENTELQLNERGHYIGNNNYTKVKAIIKIQDDSLFTRLNNNLITTLNISLVESLCGFQKEIVHPSGEIIVINTNKITCNNEEIVKAGKGMPFFNNDRTGDLIIKINVVLIDLNEYQKNIIKSIL